MQTRRKSERVTIPSRPPRSRASVGTSSPGPEPGARLPLPLTSPNLAEQVSSLRTLADQEVKEPTRATPAKADDEWLALSSSISMLCEADLMALDEDLQAVPWGSIEAHQMSSPLTALGTRA